MRKVIQIMGAADDWSLKRGYSALRQAALCLIVILIIWIGVGKGAEASPLHIQPPAGAHVTIPGKFDWLFILGVGLIGCVGILLLAADSRAVNILGCALFAIGLMSSFYGGLIAHWLTNRPLVMHIGAQLSPGSLGLLPSENHEKGRDSGQKNGGNGGNKPIVSVSFPHDPQQDEGTEMVLGAAFLLVVGGWGAYLITGGK